MVLCLKKLWQLLLYAGLGRWQHYWKSDVKQPILEAYNWLPEKLMLQLHCILERTELQYHIFGLIENDQPPVLVMNNRNQRADQ